MAVSGIIRNAEIPMRNYTLFDARQDRSDRIAINIDPEIMSGTPAFAGTRVPIDALFNNFAAGVSLNELLENFPSVSREQAWALRFRARL